MKLNYVFAALYAVAMIVFTIGLVRDGRKKRDQQR